MAGCHGGGARGLVAAGGMRLKPLAGHPLSFGYLFASHPLFDEVFVIPRRPKSLSLSKIVPHIGKHVVLTVPYQSADGTPGGINYPARKDPHKRQRPQ